ncbi:MAG: lipid A deacylase LpxR family protein [Sphingobacteriales bacterium]|nr:MAG: lipid A deacylase LpxR family protein [Sphingobacteriales bacterium]
MKQYRWLLLVWGVLCFAQKPAQIGIVSDNDLYTSPYNDQYYTNGLEFYYRYLGNPETTRALKTITEFRIGQYIYNPQSVKAADINVHDRPFAGYLFAEARISKFYANSHVLKFKFQGGVVGPESGAQQFQEGLHKLVGYYTVEGWQYQITTTPAAQAAVFYSRRISPSPYMHRFEYNWDVHLQAEVNVGTIWNTASIGPMARISLKGPLQDMHHSMLHGAELEADASEYKNRGELFLYANPSLQYMAFDATIQGSMFNNTSPVTFPLLHWRFNAEAGIKYRKNHWAYSYSFNYRGKEAINNVISGFFYGSIQVGYIL